MASMFEGFRSSHRRPSRSRSESEKQLHARWGDATITAPHRGWSQHRSKEDDDDVYNPGSGANQVHVHDSPDSQKTLVNGSPDAAYATDRAAKVPIEFPLKERSAIVITIPLPWTRKTHRRSLSVGQTYHHHQVQDNAQVEREDTVAVADIRPLVNPLRPGTAPSPTPTQTHTHTHTHATTTTTTMQYDGNGGGGGPGPSLPSLAHGYGPGPGRLPLPPLQTSLPPSRSQPVSGISILSPVAERFDGASESNNATPMGQTPIAQIAGDGVGIAGANLDGNGNANAHDVTSSLDSALPNASRSISSSFFSSSSSSSDSGPMNTKSAVARPQSRGLAVGGGLHIRDNPVEGDGHGNTARTATGTGIGTGSIEGHRSSTLREPSRSRRAQSVESTRRTPTPIPTPTPTPGSRSGPRSGSRSRSRGTSGPSAPRAGSGSVSRQRNDTGTGRRRDSPDPFAHRSMSRDASSRQRHREPYHAFPASLSSSLSPSPSSANTATAGAAATAPRRSLAMVHRSPDLSSAVTSTTSTARRSLSTGSAVHRSHSPDTLAPRINRRAHSHSRSREAYCSPRPSSPSSSSSSHSSSHSNSNSNSLGRRQVLSRGPGPGPAPSRRGSSEAELRAASVGPVVRPRLHTGVGGGCGGDTSIFHYAASATATRSTSTPTGSRSSDGANTSSDEGTEIDTDAEEGEEEEQEEEQARTDDVYFDSRKGWNGPAGMKGVESKGFYGDVVQDYRAIARDVEAQSQSQSQSSPSAGINIVSMVVNKKDRDREKEKEKDRERERERGPHIYSGPELVPSHEELWG